jgi:uncharacterized Tic20 family protein
MSEEITAVSSTKEDNNTAVIMDVAMLFVFLISPLVLYLTKKDRPFIMDQARENLNMNITVLLGWIVSAVLTIIVIGVVGYIVTGIYFLVVTILAAVANSNGKFYRYPYIIRLLK